MAGQARECVIWDDDLKGFGVRVHPTGRKVYIVKTRYRGKAREGDHRPARGRDASGRPDQGGGDHIRRPRGQRPSGLEPAGRQGADHARAWETVPR